MNKINGILMLLIYICVVTAILNPVFVGAENMGNVVRRISLFGVIGIGVAFVIVTGGIDLSIGSLIGLTGALLAMFLEVEYRSVGEVQLNVITADSSQIQVGERAPDVGAGDYLAVYDGHVRNQGIYQVNELLPPDELDVAADTSEDGGADWRILVEGTFPRGDRQGKVQRVFPIDAIDLDYYDIVVDALPVTIKPKDRLLYFSPEFQRPQELRVVGVFEEADGVHIQVPEIPENFGAEGYFSVKRRHAWPIWLAVTLVMSLVLFVGWLHGILITKVNLQPFVVTLCGLLFYRGITRTITKDQSVGFGVEYTDSLSLISKGNPCSMATLMVVAGIAVLGISLFRAYKSSSDSENPHRQRQDRLLHLLAAGAGLWAAIIGSSRFWFGFEETEAASSIWTMVVTADGNAMPARLMGWSAWLVIPASSWFIYLIVKNGWRAIRFPLLAIGISVVVFSLGIWLLSWDETRFGQWNGWANTIRIMIAFVVVGQLFACLAWLCRVGLKAGGSYAKHAILLAAYFVVLGLTSRTELAATLVPAPFFVFAVVAVISAVFMTQTLYGRYLLALGRNEQAATFSGIRTHRMIIMAYMICSFCAGLGGILFAMEINAIQPASHGNFYELYAIAAAVLGGCSLRGGEGTILGVVIGAAVMRVLRNSIFLIGIPDQLEFAIIGIVILAGVIADEYLRRFNAARRAKLEAASHAASASASSG